MKAKFLQKGGSWSSDDCVDMLAKKKLKDTCWILVRDGEVRNVFNTS